MALFFDRPWFDSALARIGKSRAELGSALGLDDEALAEIWKDQRELSARDVQVMASFLGVLPEEIADRAGISTPVPKAPIDEAARLNALEAEAARLRAKLHGPKPHLIFLITEDWYFQSHRVPLAQDALARGFKVSLATRFNQGRGALVGVGIDPIDLPWRRGLPNVGDLRTLFIMIRAYRRAKPVLVHHVALKSVLLGTLAARIAGVPKILNAVAGLGYMFTLQTPKARVLRFIFSLLARVLLRDRRVTLMFQNGDDRDILCRLIGVDPSTCVLVPGAGIDVSRYQPTPARDRPSIVVALVARMLKIKGVDIAIEATRRARAQGVDVTLRLVGPVDRTNPSGLSEGDLRTAAAEPGIEWLGHQDDIAAIWRDADIALLPSLGGEGVPKSLLEAAACGMPLIGTDVAGIRDLVLDGVTGIRVRPGDSDDLARALVILSGDYALRARYGAAARAHVEQGFSQRRVVAQIGALHQRLWDEISLPQ